MLIWLVGFVIYRMLMTVDIIVGSTLPVIVITICICFIVEKIHSRFFAR